MADLEKVLAAVEAGRRRPLYLVVGDRVLAEPAAVRLGERLAAQAGCELELHHRPESLVAILDDLRTYSLFAAAKVHVAVDSAVLVDLSAAAALIAEAAREAPSSGGGELSGGQRRAAARLMQALRLYQIDPHQGAAAEVVAALPPEAFKSPGGRAVAKSRLTDMRAGLAALLESARAAGLEGRAEGDLVQLAEVARDGLPEGHALILAESGVARAHPLVKALAGDEALVELSRVEAGKRGGWQGLDELVAELERETGVGIERQAVGELANRTLQKGRQRRDPAAVAAASADRFAAEYRKLAALTGGGSIDRAQVVEVVDDRGDEDLFQLLDAVGSGSGGDAVRRLRRYVAAAEDPMAARLSFFGLLAEFGRHLTAVAGLLGSGGVPRGERNYGRFKASIAAKLQRELDGGVPSPLAGLHPFRLHKAYLAASAAPADRLARLPWRLLETELQLKGEASRPQVALEALVVELATLAGGRG